MAQESLGTFKKGPTEVMDYTLEWDAFLVDDTISGTTTWTVPAGITKDSQAGGVTSLQSVWISGGTIGQRYKISNTIVTTAGVTAKRSFYIDVVER